ncbi:hypothetical protein ACFL6X_00485 [Candidatus Latescibacterota bacterium]
MDRFARDPRHLRLDTASGTLHLSRILNWYRGDFERWYPRGRTRKYPGEVPLLPDVREPTLVDYLILYLPAPQADYLARQGDVDIAFYEYDWALNDRPR